MERTKLHTKSLFYRTVSLWISWIARRNWMVLPFVLARVCLCSCLNLKRCRFIILLWVLLNQMKIANNLLSSFVHSKLFIFFAIRPAQPAQLLHLFICTHSCTRSLHFHLNWKKKVHITFCFRFLSMRIVWIPPIRVYEWLNLRVALQRIGRWFICYGKVNCYYFFFSSLYGSLSVFVPLFTVFFITKIMQTRAR